MFRLPCQSSIMTSSSRTTAYQWGGRTDLPRRRSFYSASVNHLSKIETSTMTRWAQSAFEAVHDIGGLGWETTITLTTFLIRILFSVPINCAIYRSQRRQHQHHQLQEAFSNLRAAMIAPSPESTEWRWTDIRHGRIATKVKSPGQRPCLPLDPDTRIAPFPRMMPFLASEEGSLAKYIPLLRTLYLPVWYACISATWTNSSAMPMASASASISDGSKSGSFAEDGLSNLHQLLFQDNGPAFLADSIFGPSITSFFFVIVSSWAVCSVISRLLIDEFLAKTRTVTRLKAREALRNRPPSFLTSSSASSPIHALSEMEKSRQRTTTPLPSVLSIPSIPFLIDPTLIHIASTVSILFFLDPLSSFLSLTPTPPQAYVFVISSSLSAFMSRYTAAWLVFGRRSETNANKKGGLVVAPAKARRVDQ